MKITLHDFFQQFDFISAVLMCLQLMWTWNRYLECLRIYFERIYLYEMKRESSCDNKVFFLSELNVYEKAYLGCNKLYKQQQN